MVSENLVYQANIGIFGPHNEFNRRYVVAIIMSIIVELSLPAQEFELGQILELTTGSRVILETVVPMGRKSIPFMRVYEESEGFESSVRQSDTVNELRRISAHDGEVLYALDWDASQDKFFEGISTAHGTILEATGRGSSWNFEIRFESHEGLSSFQAYCQGASLPVDFHRLFNPTNPESGPWYGLTPAQRKALTRAVEAGYYAIPREISTEELAAEFDISDQAMTERLRRAIDNLVTNTITVATADHAPSQTT